ncbi:MAG: ABC transporter ATP-binding protein, partial [Acidimicrobiia bacterium]|nr:ABC transporter ATP-binding protein [Acidimicrobiia bacterium]
GKTTTIKMIVGLLRPDEGTAGVEEFNTWKSPTDAKRRIGVLPEEFNLYERLTGAELLDFTAAIHGLPKAQAGSRREELLALLDLEDASRTVIGDYSRGMRKKVALAAAVIHAPPVLFLDEPFEGVDAISARLIRQLLQRYTESGATIIFSSHVMELVERLCTRIGIMVAGELIIEASPDQLLAHYGAKNVEDAFLTAVGASDATQGLEWLANSSG